MQFMGNSVVKITPERAKEILFEMNVFLGQRKLCARHVEYLSREITNNRFIVGTQIHVVVMKEKKILVNGQHTLSAIVHANKEIELTVAMTSVENEDELNKVFSRFDAPISARSNRDSLLSLGIPALIGVSATSISSAQAAIRYMDQGFSVHPQDRIYGRKRNHEDEAENAMKWKKEIALFDGMSRKRGARMFCNACIFSVALVTLRHQEAKAIEFWREMIEDNGLLQTDVRKRISTIILRNVRPKPNAMNGLSLQIVNAWNAFFKSKSLHNLNLSKNLTEIQIAGTPVIISRDINQSNR